MRAERSLEQILEAMLTVALEPVPGAELADLLDLPGDEVTATLRGLRDEFARDHRGFQVVELASGWVIQSSPEVAEWVGTFAQREVSHRLSSAALETLAIIAYRQPISRSQISALRGVNVDGVTRLLEQRGYIEETGRAPGPGQPILYGTTDLFLDRLGLASIEDLPPIEEFMPSLDAANQLADKMAADDLLEGA